MKALIEYSTYEITLANKATSTEIEKVLEEVLTVNVNVLANIFLDVISKRGTISKKALENLVEIGPHILRGYKHEFLLELIWNVEDSIPKIGTIFNKTQKEVIKMISYTLEKCKLPNPNIEGLAEYLTTADHNTLDLIENVVKEKLVDKSVKDKIKIREKIYSDFVKYMEKIFSVIYYYKTVSKR